MNPTIPPDTRRDAMLARRAELLAAHPEITAAAELASRMGDLQQEYWDWCIERHLDGETEAVNGDA